MFYIPYEHEHVSVPYHAIMMITFAKETSGIDSDHCTLVDEFVARVLKNCRGDEKQDTEVDFRTVVDARMVFHIYSHIKSQGGTMKAYPSKQLPSVTEVIWEFIAIFQKMPDWRGLDEEETRLLGTLKQIWINWYDYATETEGSDLSTLSGKLEAEVVALKSDDRI